MSPFADEILHAFSIHLFDPSLCLSGNMKQPVEPPGIVLLDASIPALVWNACFLLHLASSLSGPWTFKIPLPWEAFDLGIDSIQCSNCDFFANFIH